MFMPLLEGTDGVEKMSKSLGNYIGINEDATTMYTKVMKVPDELIIKYYELCTDVHPDDIEKVKTRLDAGENPRDIKMELAKEITMLYHTAEEAEKAEENFKSAFQQQVAPEDTPEIALLNNSENIANNLVDTILATKKYSSKGEIKRLFAQGAVRINGERVQDLKSIEAIEDGTILQIGKGNFYKIVL